MENLKLYINIPIAVKTKIDGIFQTLNQSQLNKIYFLVYKINKEVKAQINIKNYTYLFGWKHPQTSKVITELVNNLIIEKVDNYVVKQKSNAYSVVNKFKESTTDFRLKYNSDFDKLPIWVQRYCTDAGNAKSKEYTSFKKTVKADRLNELETENEALKLEILELKAKLNLPDVTNVNPKIIEEYDEAEDAMTIEEGSKVIYIQPYIRIKSYFEDANQKAKILNKLKEANDGHSWIHTNENSIKIEKGTRDDAIVILLTA